MRTFHIDPNIYAQFKNDEEKRFFLLKKMEEDIREGLMNLDKNQAEKNKQFIEETKAIKNEENKVNQDPYEWLKLNSEFEGMHPKLKLELMKKF